MKSKIVYIVHCVDTEGPLTESIEDTFIRVKNEYNIELSATQENLSKLQNQEIPLNGLEIPISRMLHPDLLNYKSDWNQIEEMLNYVQSKNFRYEMPDSFGGGWIYSWHCMDHLPTLINPRHKDIGYGNIFHHYQKRKNLPGNENDEINWHFHPISYFKNPLIPANSFLNNMSNLTYLIARRIIDDNWFPVVNRPGFHSERQDSNNFLENWIPFDFGNQFYEFDDDQIAFTSGRFGDWRRATPSWRGYRPDHHDYQISGESRRYIFRCLNVGTRIRMLQRDHVRQAFEEAGDYGSSILAFTNHDWREISKDVNYVRNLIADVWQKYPKIQIKYSGAHEAAINHLGYQNRNKLNLSTRFEGNKLIIEVKNGEIFGNQPFLALKSLSGDYFHDNLDEILPKKSWSYTFDELTIPLSVLDKVGIGSAGKFGHYDTKVLQIKE